MIAREYFGVSLGCYFQVAFNVFRKFQKIRTAIFQCPVMREGHSNKLSGGLQLQQKEDDLEYTSLPPVSKTSSESYLNYYPYDIDVRERERNHLRSTRSGGASSACESVYFNPQITQVSH